MSLENDVEKLEERAREAFKRKHNQLDLFVAQLVDASPKSDRHSMEHPLFALSKRKDMRIREYEHGDTKITVTPSVLGAATIWDKDIIIYCGSQIVAAINRGEKVSQWVEAESFSILKNTGRSTGGSNYEQLIAALKRLEGTRITTTIKTGGLRETRGFGLIDEWEVAERSPTTDRPLKVRIRLSDWCFRALVTGEVLTLNQEYFELTGGLERRLYELARKHVGRQQSTWRIKLENLQKKTGANSSGKLFRSQIKKIVERNELPDYEMGYDRAADRVDFWLRPQA